jgi:hypothetical protein
MDRLPSPVLGEGLGAAIVHSQNDLGSLYIENIEKDPRDPG